MRSFFILLLLAACATEIKTSFTIQGNTQGTTYKIIYKDSLGRKLNSKIDSLLIAIDNSLSTYNPNSLVSEYNLKGKTGPIDYHFLRMLKESWNINKETGKAFDPTVMPLIEYWGFSGEKIKEPELVDSSVIDSMRTLVNMEEIVVLETNGESISIKDIDYSKEYRLKYAKNKVQLNFNAIAQGYTVDAIAELLEQKNIRHYMVEVGGEVKVSGTNFKNQNWRIGIDKPKKTNEQDRELKAVLTLTNCAVATSGNYRKFYIKDGIKQSHTLNPATGYPVQHNLLSVTVVTDKCATADAYATAFLVMGMEKTKEFLKQNPELNLEAYLIYYISEKELNTFATSKIETKIEEFKE